MSFIKLQRFTPSHVAVFSHFKRCLSFVAAVFLVVACGQGETTKSGEVINKGPVIDSSSKGFLFVGADDGSDDYGLYFYEFSTGDVSLLYSSRSRDTAILFDGTQYLVFERFQGALRYYSVTFEAGKKPYVDEQGIQPYFVGASGDPADVLLVSSTGSSTTSSPLHILAQPNAGSIVIADMQQRTIKTTIDKDGFSGWTSALRPVKLLDAGSSALVLNQGLQFNGIAVQENQQQSVISIKKVDATQIAKVSLQRPYAMHMAFTDSSKQKIAVLDLCIKVLGSNCQNGFELINTSNLTFLSSNLMSRAFNLNGAIVDAQAGAFYAQTLDENDKSVLMKIKLDVNGLQSTITDAFSLEATEPVALAWLADSGGLLLYGDHYGDEQGVIMIQGEQQGQIVMPEVPRQGIVVR